MIMFTMLISIFTAMSTLIFTMQMDGMMASMTAGLENDLEEMMGALEQAVANNQVLVMMMMVVKIMMDDGDEGDYDDYSC